VNDELISKAVTHLPFCFLIAFEIWAYIMLTLLAIAGAVVLLVGGCLAIKRTIFNRTFSRRSRRTPVEADEDSGKYWGAT
jgi:hypothetical protein